MGWGGVGWGGTGGGPLGHESDAPMAEGVGEGGELDQGGGRDRMLSQMTGGGVWLVKCGMGGWRVLWGGEWIFIWRGEGDGLGII